MKVQEQVVLVIDDEEITATVALVSSNGKSVGLTFKGAIRIGGLMLAVGTALLSQQDDGTWLEISTQKPVTVRRLS